MATFVSHGREIDGAIDDLEELCNTGGHAFWTVNHNAEPGDTIVFYIHAPVSAFVAVGRVHGEPFEDDGEFGWDGHHMADISVEHVVDPPLKRTVALDHLPEWRWLNSPQAAARVPENVEERLLELLQAPAQDAGEQNKPVGGAGFGTDPERNKAVEFVAVDAVRQWFVDEGWTVESRESETCGYDLLCRKGRSEQHVEVKGVAGEELCFMITANEVTTAKRDSQFLLSVVTNALSPEKLEMYDFTGRQLLEEFELEPVTYRATSK